MSNDFAAAPGAPARWARAPRAVAPGAVERHALRRAGVRAWAVPLAAAHASDGTWLRATRATGLMPAIVAPPAALTEAVLVDLVAVGRVHGLPMLIIVDRGGSRPAGDGDSAAAPMAGFRATDWLDLRDRLARLDLPGLRIAAPGWPACHTASWRPDVVMSSHAASSRIPGGSGDPRCAPCAVRGTCAGPLDADECVQPVPVAISNQFDVVQVDDSGGTTGDACPGVGTLRLVGQEGGGTAAAEPPTGTWHWVGTAVDAAEVAQTLRRGQLYFDGSRHERLDDFAAQLRALDAVHAPHDRPGAGFCGGVWRVRDAEPFGAEEAALRAELGQLSGTVVDVGAGPVRYLDVLRPALAAGRVRYVAIEPDAAALRTLAAALPGAVTLQGRGEALPLRAACADAVILLRSWNHVGDLGAAVRELARVCRSGATLLAVDNVTFGLLRTPDQLRRAHAVSVAQTPFEHYRNDDAPDFAVALARWAPGAFELRDCDPVRPGGSNQWRVRAIRTGSGAGG